MFYSQVILARKEPLGKIWLAAHFDKKLTKTQIFATDICSTVENVLNPSWPLALRVSGQLMLGIVRIYSRKVKYLMTDCTEAMWKIKLAFKPGNIDLELDANQASTNNVDDTRYFGHINPEFDFPELADAAFSQGLLNKYAILKAARGRTIANQRETIEEDYFSSQKIGREVRDSHASKLQGRNDQNEWSPSQGRVSDIEVFRGEHSISEPRLMRSSISSMGSGMAATFDVDTIPAFEEYPLRPMESDQIYDNFVPYDMQVDNYVPPIAEDLVENRLSEIMTENFLPIEESPQKQRRSHDPDTSLASLKEQKTAINKRKKQKVLVDDDIELDSNLIREHLDNVSPIMRRHLNDLPLVSSSSKAFSSEELLYEPSIQGLCPELFGMFKVTMVHRNIPILSDGSVSVEQSAEVLNNEVEISRAPHEDPTENEPSRDTSMLNADLGNLNESSQQTSLFFEREANIENLNDQMNRIIDDIPGFDDTTFSISQDNVNLSNRLSSESEAYNSSTSRHIYSDKEMMKGALALHEDVLRNVGDIQNLSADSTSWSARTTLVYDVIKSQEAQQNDQTASFLEISSGCSRRVAASSFLEVLQLKTWGYVDCNQDEPFSDIRITTTQLKL